MGHFSEGEGEQHNLPFLSQPLCWLPPSAATMGSSLLFCLPSVAFLAIFEVLPLIFFESHHLFVHPFLHAVTCSLILFHSGTRFSKPYFDMRWGFFVVVVPCGSQYYLEYCDF